MRPFGHCCTTFRHASRQLPAWRDRPVRVSRQHLETTCNAPPDRITGCQGGCRWSVPRVCSGSVLLCRIPFGVVAAGRCEVRVAVVTTVEEARSLVVAFVAIDAPAFQASRPPWRTMSSTRSRRASQSHRITGTRSSRWLRGVREQGDARDHHTAAPIRPRCARHHPRRESVAPPPRGPTRGRSRPGQRPEVWSPVIAATRAIASSNVMASTRPDPRVMSAHAAVRSQTAPLCVKTRHGEGS